MKEYRFRLDIPREEIVRYYAGESSAVRVKARSGHNVRFPASALRPFVTPNGVQGEFLLQVNDDNRLVSLQIVSSATGEAVP